MDTLGTDSPTLVPLLVVRDASRAVDFYVDGLGAKQLRLYLHPNTNAISHVDLAIDGATFSITEEARAWNSDAPPSLGGSPVVLQLYVRQVDAVFERMCRAGATIVFPLQEFAGERMGRLRDPFGHLWLLRAGPVPASPTGNISARC
jgi:PhnB protein